jgi:hypothetical protein
LAREGILFSDCINPLSQNEMETIGYEDADLLQLF